MSVSDDEQYYVFFNEQQIGPLTPESVRTMIRARHVTAGAYFWKDGFRDWKELFPSNPNDTGSPKQLARLHYFGIETPLHRDWVFDLIDHDEQDPTMKSAIQRWHQAKYRLHPDLFPRDPRTKQDAQVYQWMFGQEGEYGQEFRKPTQQQIVDVLSSLDRDEPGWDKGTDSTAREKSFLFELATLFPELRKKDCTF